jgi:hypothetical protein
MKCSEMERDAKSRENGALSLFGELFFKKMPRWRDAKKRPILFGGMAVSGGSFFFKGERSYPLKALIGADNTPNFFRTHINPHVMTKMGYS